MKLHYILLKNAAFLLFSIPLLVFLEDLAIAENVPSNSAILTESKENKPVATEIAQATPVKITNVQINPTISRLEIIRNYSGWRFGKKGLPRNTCLSVSRTLTPCFLRVEI